MKKIIASLFMAILLLTGCSSGTASADVEMEFWIPGAEDEYGFYYDAARQYSEEHEGVTITPVQQPWGDYWTKLPLEIQNGRGPGLFITHTSYSDVLAPISAELEMTTGDLEALGYSNTDLYLGENGNPMFIPVLYAPNVVYYNKTMWSEAGLTEEDIPTSWDQLAKLSEQLENKDSKVIGFDYSFHVLYDLTIQAGEQLVNDDDTANFSKDALNKILSWEEAGVTNYMSYGAGSPEESFLQGAAAMIYGQPWMANYFSNTMPDLEFGAFEMPAIEGSDVHVTSQAELSPGINKNLDEEQMAVAQDFMNWMLSDEDVMLSIAEGNNAASSNSNYLADQNYEQSSAGAAAVSTIENGNDMFVVIPSTLEDAYKVLVESVIANDGASIDSDIEKANSSVGNTDLTMTKELEQRKLSE